jgi:alpha-ketoglutarate-dependent 2,4-dichlorophenoxyacetate dioxygenase
MPVTFRQLHPYFVAEVGAPDLRHVHDRQALSDIRAAMDKYAVLVFRNQEFIDDEQLLFAQRFDGALRHRNTGAPIFGKGRLAAQALTEISNLDENGEILRPDDRRRMYSLGDRLWHTDASFQDPPGRYSMLWAMVVPPISANTEFADMRVAYDALSAETKAKLNGLRAYHSIVYSRQTLGFEYTDEEQAMLKGAIHSIVRINLRTQRASLYLASHASRIIDWPIPEGRLFLRDLIEHATQPQFVYRHAWQSGDFVIWDNRVTMHRGRAFNDTKYGRRLRRVTTLDSDSPPLFSEGG